MAPLGKFRVHGALKMRQLHDKVGYLEVAAGD